MIGDGARNAAIAVFERVDGDEPEMRDACLEHRIGSVGIVLLNQSRKALIS